MFSEFTTYTTEEWWNDVLKTAKVQEKSALMAFEEENLNISPIYSYENSRFAKILPKKQNGFIFKHFNTINPTSETDAEVFFFQNKQKNEKITETHAQMMPLEKYLEGKNQNFVFSARGFKENGAGVSQQLAFLLGKWVAQADFLVENEDFLIKKYKKSISLIEFAQKTTFVISIGRNFFVEIAKFRACRLLWARILEIYNLKNDIPLEIHAFTGLNNKSLLDMENNLLRNTTEAMSAVVGNADVLTIFPYNFPQEATENSKRWAENIANLIVDEARMTTTQDMLAGAYSIETLTQEICKNSWSFFQKIIQKGGVFGENVRDFLQNECEKNIHRIKTNIAHKKQPLVGVHIYQNPNETEKRVFSKDKNLLFDIAEGWKVVFLEDF